MRCNTAKRQIERQLDNELSADLIRELDLHLKQCSACRAYREQMLRLMQLLQKPAQPEFPAWLHHQIMDQAAQHDKKRLHIKHRRRLQLIPAMLAVIISLALGAVIGKNAYGNVNPLPDTRVVASDQKTGVTEVAAFGESSLLGDSNYNGAINE